MTTIKYPFIPAGREFLYVGIDNVFMKEAMEYARKYSTDRMHPTGAVIVKDGVVLGGGANTSKLPLAFLRDAHQEGLCIRKILKIKSGTKYWMCPGCVTNDDHAEAHAIRDAIKNGHNTVGTDLYLWGHWWCCEPCWQKMIAAGISKAYLLDDSENLFNPSSPENILGKQFSPQV